MDLTHDDNMAIEKLLQISHENNIDIKGGKISRTSSRFCFGVEHGDYNGTELFGVGTDRFIWMAYRPNGTDKVKLYSANFPDDGVIEFTIGDVPEPKSTETADTWARFPYGVEYILRREGIKLEQGIDGIIYGNIPGGGMSRSASLSLNLILSLLDANRIEIKDQFKIVDMAQAVENNYIGSPCGQLDQIMILFAKADMGTHYNPKTKSIDYVRLGKGASNFRIMVLDTGTERPGLEKSTYKIRRAECEKLVSLLQGAGYDIKCLADVKEQEVYDKITGEFADKYPDLCDRLKYIYSAQKRFYEMLDAWKGGDIETVGRLFREDGLGLRDDYKISGPELETMCDIARTVEGVLGERMLGGGDKGASGALVLAESADALKEAIMKEYGRKSDKWAVHSCKVVDGVKVLEGVLD
ncbi:MAG: galactokinase [Planctomycetota bacterium]|jgi:galactokinase